ncbi:MAG: secretin N-terminal domain-containing protein [Burkholderiales bacterium]
MNRANLVRSLAAAALAGAACVTWAQQALEIIPLRHRTAEQVLPALQPLVEPGGTLSGSRGQLFLRASPGNVAEIRRALEAIDRPSRRLQISVRLDDALERERRSIEASGTIGSSSARVGISAQDARSAAGERVDQRVQVLEGGRAMIFTGQSRPYQDLASGFEVVPRLAGGSVILEILQRRDTRQQQQMAATTISARLGEWVEIGGTASAAARDDRGIGSASSTRAAESRGVWVKVEELPN